MKKLILFLTFYIQLLMLLGQAPQSFNYQAVIRDSSNNIINNIVNISRFIKVISIM